MGASDFFSPMILGINYPISYRECSVLLWTSQNFFEEWIIGIREIQQDFGKDVLRIELYSAKDDALQHIMNRLTLNSPKGKLNVFPTNEHEMCC
jgi:hypothetical protein